MAWWWQWWQERGREGVNRDRTNKRMGHFEQKHEMPASTEAGSRRKGRHPAGQSPSHGSPRLLRRANRIDKQNRKGEGQKCTSQESWVKGLGEKIRGRLKVGHSLTPIGLQVEAAKVL